MTAASVSDVATTLGRPITDLDEVKQVNAWIALTERIIRHRLGDVSLLDQDNLKDVEAEVVARRVKNPDGKDNERIDDYSYGLVPEAKAVGLKLTDDEWELLTPDGGVGAWMPVVEPAPWVSPGHPRRPYRSPGEEWS
jgi:hypothetical protein